MEEIKDPRMWKLFEIYSVWCSLPRFYAKFPNDKLESYGLGENDIELVKIPTKKAFSEEFDVSLSTLRKWDNSKELKDKLKETCKGWAKKLTPNVVGKLYQMIMEEGDAPRIKLWTQFIEEEKEEVNLNTGLEKILENMKEDGDIDGDNISEHKGSAE